MIMAKTGEIITAAGQVNIVDGNTYYGGYLSWEWKIKEDVIKIFNGGIMPTNRPTGGNSIMQDDNGVVYICGRNSTVIRQEYNGGEFSSNWEVFQVGEPGIAWGGIIQLRNGLYFMTGNRMTATAEHFYAISKSGDPETWNVFPFPTALSVSAMPNTTLFIRPQHGIKYMVQNEQGTLILGNTDSILYADINEDILL